MSSLRCTSMVCSNAHVNLAFAEQRILPLSVLLRGRACLLRQSAERHLELSLRLALLRDNSQ